MLSLPAGQVICLPINLDRFGRTVATCSVGGADLSECHGQNGLALDAVFKGQVRHRTALSKPGEAFGPAAMSID
jgi:hypothetical protein